MSDSKIHITFDSSKDERYADSPAAGENLWATAVTHKPGQYVVRSVPFFSYDVSLHDVVETEDGAFGPEVVRVVGNGGLGLLRAMVTDGALPDIVEALEQQYPAAQIEGGFGLLLTVAVAQSDIASLTSWLDARSDVSAIEIGKA